MPKRGFEPRRDFSHCPLKTACLPIPPLRRHVDFPAEGPPRDGRRVRAWSLGPLERRAVPIPRRAIPGRETPAGSQGFFLDNAACALRIVGQQVQTDDDQHVKRRQYGRHLTQESRGAPAAEHLAGHAAGWATRSESAGQATALARLQQDRQDQNETDHDVYCNCGGKHGMYPSIGERRQRIRIR